jgi:CelD/BcsL family acetyltransferase involved in cellulose biosynthesis
VANCPPICHASAIVDLAASDPRWSAFVAARQASLFHSPAWAAVLRDTYGFEVRARALTDPRGEIVAGLPICRIDDAIGGRIVALPFSDHCTPLVDDPTAWRALFDSLRAHDRPLTVSTLGNAAVPPTDGLAIAKRARWHGIELDTDSAEAWARLAPPRRRAIRKALREGVRIEIGAGERFRRDFVRMHVAVRKHKYRLLAQPAAFFAAIERAFTAAGAWLPLAAFHNGRCIAATIFVGCGDTLYYRFNTSDRAALAVRPNDLLLWEGIRLARERGYRRLDLGRSDDDQPGLIRFKRQFGSVEEEIRLLRYLPPRYAGGREAAARRLLNAMTSLLTKPSIPDEIAAAAGSALYRYFA